MSFTGHAQDLDSFAKGKALFQSGLLSEAVLALEAEVQRQPKNVDAWRLLGTVHAENDDDQQARTLRCSWGNAKYMLHVVTEKSPCSRCLVKGFTLACRQLPP